MQEPLFAPPRVEATRLDDGGLVLRSPEPLRPYARSLGDVLERWADEAPDRAFLAERAPGGGWRTRTYAEVRADVRALGQALLDLGAEPRRPILLLSDNAVDHACVQLAGMHVGVPVAPISPAYSLLSNDLVKLREIAAVLDPSVVYAADGALFARAIEALDLGETPLVVSQRPPPGARSFLLDDLRRTAPGAAAREAFARVGPDTVAKVLFTSGSTGAPKGVANTQRMMCSNQQAIAQLWPFLSRRPPVVVDWLPWSHTFGGNHNFNMVLWHGGTLYVDGGKPAPGRVEVTVDNLRAVAPTLYFNVPRGFDALLPFLEVDEPLRRTFFSELDLLFYAAAALPQHLWERLERASLSARGDRVAMVSAWGSTETAPLATGVHFPIACAGVIGLPAPGTTIKLAPDGDKLELRVRGPNVTPGMWTRGGALGPAALDGEGFLRTGDAARLEDAADPSKGIVFEGRIAENFKLSSGTWVSVGAVRTALVAACAPLIQDAVIAGHDRDELAALLFPSPGALGAVGTLPSGGADLPLADLVRRPEVRAAVARLLAAYGRAHPGSSTRIARAVLLVEPPSIDGGEITDKGYLNQRAVLARRAAWVERLYGAAPDEDVIAAEG